MKFSLRKRNSKKDAKEKIDYLNLPNKEKLRLIGMFCLKWGLIILIPSALIWILLYFLTDFSGSYFFQYILMIIPGALLIVGGCMGGLSRYNIPPKMRIVEPDDQAVTPSDFQIRVKYDQADIDPSTIEILINDKSVKGQISEDSNVVIIPKIFKTPPKKAVTMLITAKAIRKNGKDIQDKIRIICDPEFDEEDYQEYWEFKREDDTYWGKEMIAAAKHARRNFFALQLLALSILLLIVNTVVTYIVFAIKGSPL